MLRAIVDTPADTSETIESAIFSQADLRNYSFLADKPQLSNAYLEGANLDHAVPTGARFSFAFLLNASLTSAFLDKAQLDDADLIIANLSGADLRGPNLKTPHIEKTNFSSARLGGANVDREDWLEWPRKKGAQVDRGKWQVVPTGDPRECRPSEGVGTISIEAKSEGPFCSRWAALLTSGSLPLAP